MTDRKKKPVARAGKTGAGNSKLGRRNRTVTFTVTPHEADAAPVTIATSGRALWALERLAGAGPKGCSPITEPALRWAAYVHTLRGLDVPIETIHEEHEGDFPGTHARYVLRATVTPETEGGAFDGKII